jgi:uncharacterized membrane protein
MLGGVTTLTVTLTILKDLAIKMLEGDITLAITLIILRNLTIDLTITHHSAELYYEDAREASPLSIAFLPSL